MTSISRFAKARFAGLLLLASSCVFAASPPHFSRVIYVILENQDYDVALGDEYLAGLAKQGVLLTDFHASTHPSYPNYLSMVAGDTFGLTSDEQKSLDARSIADLLEAKGLHWKNYAEGFPGNCFLGKSHKRYARKHVPFLSFKTIQSDPARCANIVSATQFQDDWQKERLPEYSFFSPDMDDDGHDTGLDPAAGWLKAFLTPILADTAGMSGTLIIVTFDESADYSGTNQIYTLLLGPMLKRGFTYSEHADFYRLLRTIEDNFGLRSLGKHDAKSAPLEGIWKPISKN